MWLGIIIGGNLGTQWKHWIKQPLQTMLGQAQASMHKIYTLRWSILKHFCKCKALTPSQVNTQDIHLYPHLSQKHSSWHCDLMYIKCTVLYMYEVLICSLFTLFPILTNSNAPMHLYHMSIKMEISGFMAHSTYLKWMGGKRDSSAETPGERQM